MLEVNHYRRVVHLKRVDAVTDAGWVLDHLLGDERLMRGVQVEHLLGDARVFFQESLLWPVAPDVSRLSFEVLAGLWHYWEITVDVFCIEINHEILGVEFFVLGVEYHELVVAGGKELAVHENILAGVLEKLGREIQREDIGKLILVELVVDNLVPPFKAAIDLVHITPVRGLEDLANAFLDEFGVMR